MKFLFRHVVITINTLIILYLMTLYSSYAQNLDNEKFQTCNELGQEWRNVEGVWVSAVGPLELSVNGNKVTGMYNQRTWVISLEYSLDKKILFGEWDHQNGLKGPVILLLSDNGCIRHGLWGGVGKPQCLPKDYVHCINNWAIHGLRQDIVAK